MQLVSAEQVQQLLPMADAIEVMDAAMRAFSQSEVAMPARIFERIEGSGGDYGLMPASSAELGFTAIKQLSLYPSNPSRGLPSVQGLVSLFGFEDGRPLAVLDAASITAVRTAAASGLATRELARENASTLGILGTGVQMPVHIDAVRAVRGIDTVLICGRDTERTRQLARREAVRTGLEVHAAGPQEAAACDVICTLTASAEPVLSGAWVQPGAHINLVGAHTLTTRECDSELVRDARLYMDSHASCLAEGGDLMIPLQEGVITEAALLGEIGEVLLGAVEGRHTPEDVTIYNSLGIAAEDLFAAAEIYRRLTVG